MSGTRKSQPNSPFGHPIRLNGTALEPKGLLPTGGPHACHAGIHPDQYYQSISSSSLANISNHISKVIGVILAQPAVEEHEVLHFVWDPAKGLISKANPDLKIARDAEAIRREW